jgi:hypothetical protein
VPPALLAIQSSRSPFATDTVCVVSVLEIAAPVIVVVNAVLAAAFRNVAVLLVAPPGGVNREKYSLLNVNPIGAMLYILASVVTLFTEPPLTPR